MCTLFTASTWQMLFIELIKEIVVIELDSKPRWRKPGLSEHGGEAEVQYLDRRSDTT